MGKRGAPAASPKPATASRPATATKPAVAPKPAAASPSAPSHASAPRPHSRPQQSHDRSRPSRSDHRGGGRGGDSRFRQPDRRDEYRQPVGTENRSRQRPPPEPSQQEREEHHARWSLDSFQVPPKEGFSRFHDFNLPSQIMHAVHDLGFKYCTPIQAKVLAHVTKGQNIAGRAQTGTGKTAAFLICAFRQFIEDEKLGVPRLPGAPRALILAPTRELVVQIAKDAHAIGKYCKSRCVAVYGGMDFDSQRRELSHGMVDIVAATPGRLLDFLNRRILDLKHVEVLVIDEADRMLDMGFIPDVRRIIRHTPPKDRRKTMLYSATLTGDVMSLASQWMPDPVICEIEPEKVTVDTVKQIVYIVTVREKLRLLCNLLDDPSFKKVLIFGNRRDSTRYLVQNLEKHGIRCGYLSGDVRQEMRMKVLEGFRDGRIRVVVATDVAGRGLHVDGITHVVNYDFPYEAEDYVHRIGRTGRAGVDGTAISFACEDESFVIPAIEKYIGNALECVVPPESLLAARPENSRSR